VLPMKIQSLKKVFVAEWTPMVLRLQALDRAVPVIHRTHLRPAYMGPIAVPANQSLLNGLDAARGYIWVQHRSQPADSEATNGVLDILRFDAYLWADSAKRRMKLI